MFQIISIISSSLMVIGYIPEIYNLGYSAYYKTPLNEITSRLIWLIWFSSSSLGAIYGFLIKDYYVTINFSINALLIIILFILKYLQTKT